MVSKNDLQTWEQLKTERARGVLKSPVAVDEANAAVAKALIEVEIKHLKDLSFAFMQCSGLTDQFGVVCNAIKELENGLRW